MTEAVSVSRAVTGSDGRTMTFEAGRLAGLANGAVLAKLGDTTVLVAATAAKKMREGQDFFPLTVDIEERQYAAGKIPGSFFRREGRATTQAILVCRLIDRPLRPSFPDGFRNEVHVVGTVFGADQHNPYDVLAINGASAALAMSDIPFTPVGAVRIAYTQEGEWVPHPTYQESEEATLDMVVAGRLLDDGDVAIMMVEAGGTEKAWEFYQDGAPKVDEKALAQGLEASKQWIREAIELQHELVEVLGGKPEGDYPIPVDYTDEILAAVQDHAARIGETQTIADKSARGAAEDEAKAEVLEALLPRFAEVDGAEDQIKAAFRSVAKQEVRKRIVNEGQRIDGRGVTDIRPLSAEVGLIPTAHGSGLFERGETQVLNIATLGMPRMEQFLDSIDPYDSKRYMHHYNFPPFSTGETGFMRGPKRREIGHGALAEKALMPVIPTPSEFPYVLRLVSEVLSSNGSTSMASVCGSTLSLMDAGVPIKAPVAGIAMGLVYAEGKYVTLTDILGAEDAFGDMDFKVAGTADFVTALQLDTKIDGIPADVLAAALDQARDARMKILDVIHDCLPGPRDEVADTAPKIISFEIPIDKIGEVIGPKGKTINTIQQETGADISVDDDGTVGVVSIGSTDTGAVKEAERQIKLILNPPTAEVGATYTGKVVNITKFGAFVNILPGRDGLLHISKIGGGKRIDKVEDVFDLGDEVEVVVEDVDPNGKVSLRRAGDEPSSGDRSGGGRERRGGRDRDRDRDRDRGERSSSDRGDRDSSGNGDGEGDDRDYVSFEDAFDEEITADVGDLGPGREDRSRRGGGRRRSGGGRRRR